MAESEEFTFTIAWQDFDRELLPPDAREPGTDAFRGAVTKLIQDELTATGGWSRVVVDDTARTIRASWRHAPGRPDPLEVAVGRLRGGDYPGGVRLLEVLRHRDRDNPRVLYNLGMALSDLGRLAEAEAHLGAAVRLDPADANARVALGVALVRRGRIPDAIRVLGEAVQLDPGNPFAQRNLGGCLLQAGRVGEAEACLRRAAELSPDDQQAVYGLAQALERLDRKGEADEQYARAIAINGRTQLAELARQARSRFAQESLRAKVGGGVRIDAVMYCLGALERFEKMAPAEVQKVAFEIALLGQRGLDTNDPAQKYQLRSLPGRYSGLHLVSLMYVAFRAIAPEQDIGFDLAAEYAAAQALHRERSGG